MKKKANKRQVEIKIEVYNHLLNAQQHLAATVCLLVDLNGVVARGVSLCSESDQFSRKDGRRYALRYALRALKGRPCKFSRDEAKELLHKIPELKIPVLKTTGSFPKKGELNPTLTNFESELIRKSQVKHTTY